jgi:glycosyltransferase involved in cell wall biosynthesis
MNLLWIHDQPFSVDREGTVYSAGQCPYSLWQRYLKHFDSLVVVAHRIPLTEGQESTSKLSVSSGPKVDFIFIPRVRSARKICIGSWRSDHFLNRALSKADAVVARLPSYNGTILIKDLRALGKPYLIELVACAWDASWKHGSLIAKVAALPFAMKTRAIVAKAPFVLYVTRNFLQSRYPTMGHAAHISDVSVPAIPQHVKTIHQQRSFRPAPKILGMVTSLKPKYKGIHVAIRALALLRKRGYSFHLKILGPGAPDQWRRFASRYAVSNAVEFCGALPAGEPVFKWLDDIDIYLHPSVVEGLPRSLVEAMSRGCPALASTAGGIPELLPSDCLHRPGDWRSLANGIERIYHDVNWRNKLVENNLAEAAQYLESRLTGHRDLFLGEFAKYVRECHR